MLRFRSKRSICLLGAFAVSAAGVAGYQPAQAGETVTYRYDAKGRLVKVERLGTANNGVNTQYSHDKANNRKSVKTTGSPNPVP